MDKETSKAIEGKIYETLESWRGIDDFNTLVGVVSNLIFNLLDDQELKK